MPGRMILAAAAVAALTAPGLVPAPPEGWPAETRYPPAAYPISARFGGTTGIAGVPLAAPNPGIDIIARVRTPAVAAGFGFVALAATEPGRGRVVEIATTGTGTPYRLVYAHLHKITVEEGQPVRPGEEVGEIGDTGTVPRGIAHLRFEMRREDGRPVDPEPYLRSRPHGLIQCAEAELTARHPSQGGYALDRFAATLSGARPGAPLIYPVGCVRP